MRFTSSKLIYSMIILGGMSSLTNVTEVIAIEVSHDATTAEDSPLVRMENETKQALNSSSKKKTQKLTLKQGWHNSYESAIAEAKKSGKPVLLHFYADWCGPCLTMEQTVLNTSTVTSLLGNKLIAAKINVDHNAQTKAQFGVSRYPTDVFIKADGTVISQTSGVMDANAYAAKLASIGSQYSVAASSNKEERKVAVKSQKASSNDKVIALQGYSPVSLLNNEKWQKGLSKFAWNYEGVVYYMADKNEFEQFKLNPAHYAPRLQGCDATVYSENNERVTKGNIKNTIFFNGGVYLFKNKQNLDIFMGAPWRYSVQDQVVKAVESDDDFSSMIN